jgi:hypothetical protein
MNVAAPIRIYRGGIMQTVDAQELVKGLQAKARQEGRDLWEVMEADGLMLTKIRHRQVKAQAVSSMLYILDRETAEGILRRYLGGRPATPQDMFDAMLEWVKDYRDGVEAGHVG